MTDRCEPPPELRGVDGWHEIERPSGGRFIAKWEPQPERRCNGCWVSLVGAIDADTAYGMYGWRYLAPVATPAEVDALKAERDAAIARDRNASAAHATRATDLWLVTEERDNLRAGTDRLIAERTTLRARVARLEEALRSADALLCADGYTVTHPVVHAIASALSAETP